MARCSFWSSLLHQELKSSSDDEACSLILVTVLAGLVILKDRFLVPIVVWFEGAFLGHSQVITLFFG